MKIQKITLTELKQNLGEYINRVAYGKDPILLLSHGRERAALISIEDLRLLEMLHAARSRETYLVEQTDLLDEARLLREEQASAGYQTDAEEALRDVREEGSDDLLGLS